MKLTLRQIRAATNQFTLPPTVTNKTLLAIATGNELTSSYTIPAASTGTGVTATLLGADELNLPADPTDKAAALYNNPQLLIGLREFHRGCLRTDYQPELKLLMKLAAIQALANKFDAANIGQEDEAALPADTVENANVLVTRQALNAAITAATTELARRITVENHWFRTQLTTGILALGITAIAITNEYIHFTGEAEIAGHKVDDRVISLPTAAIAALTAASSLGHTTFQGLFRRYRPENTRVSADKFQDTVQTPYRTGPAV